MAVDLPPAPAIYLLLGSLPLLVISETTSSHTGHALFKILSSVAFVSTPLIRLSATSSAYHSLITAGLVFSVLGDILLIPSRKEFYGLDLTLSDAVNEKHGDQGKTAVAKLSQEPQISLSFQLGVVAFACAHIAYILAFLRDSPGIISWTAFATTLAASLALSKWLGVIYPAPVKNTEISLMSSNVLNLALPKDMRPLVLAYSTIIGTMLAVAVSTTTSFWHQRVLGAAMFAVSDVFVAKDAFGVKPPTSRNPGERHKKERKWWLQTATGFGLYFWGQMVLAGTLEGK